MRAKLSLLAVVVLTCLSGAYGIDLINPSFEEPAIADGGWSGTAVGWTCSGSGVLNPAGNMVNPEATDGLNVVYLVACGGSVSQQLPGSTVLDYYVVQCDVARRTDWYPEREPTLEISIVGATSQIVYATDTYTLANVYQQAGEWTTQVLELNVGATYSEPALLKITNIYNVANCEGQIILDNVIMPEPRAPKNPTPADNATLVSKNTNLSWEAPFVTTNLQSYSIVIATDENLTNVVEQAGSLALTPTTYDISVTLNPETEYFWRVDAVFTGGTYSSDVWSFTTKPDAAVVTDEPDSVTVAIGGTATFTVVGQDVENYAWYKEGDATVLSTTDTLTIDPVALADEGYYYCVVSNVSGSDQSDNARLLTARLTGHWKMDGDLTDVSGGGYTGVVVGNDPNWVTGVDNQAMDFDGNVTHVEIPEPAAFEYYNRGFSASCWIKCTGNDFVTMVAQHSGAAEENWSGWMLTHVNAVAYFALRGIPAADFTGTTAINDGQWHHVVGVYDAVNEIAAIYVDGVLDESRDASTGTFKETSAPVRIGAYEPPDTPLSGPAQIDDVRLFSYGLTSKEVAILYTDFVPGVEICYEYPTTDLTGPEGVPDCVVDLWDFALMAGEWLECNLVPLSACQN